MTFHIKHPSLEYPGIVHGFYGRKDGVSSGIYTSLNCSMRTDSRYNYKDTDANVMRNREIVSNDLGFGVGSLFIIKQTHSNIVRIVDGSNYKETGNGDAIVTKTPGILLGIQTADCCPFLFLDPKKNVIAVAHAGWGGAFLGILQNTISAMKSLGSDVSDVVAVLGPSISVSSYEVKNDFKEKFLAQSAANAAYFYSADKEGRTMFDLKSYSIDIVKQEGVLIAENLDIDTYAQKDDFFSFRRATHEGICEVGGQLSAIGITNAL